MAVNLERAPTVSPYSHIYVPGAGHNNWQRAAHRARQGGMGVAGGATTVLGPMQPPPGVSPNPNPNPNPNPDPNSNPNPNPNLNLALILT